MPYPNAIAILIKMTLLVLVQCYAKAPPKNYLPSYAFGRQGF
ncbi:hypothetical protein CZ787_05560 [Halomonas citrativorans]|uniref:Uncharacterized protein n=1 Tax=Halomonas citrativorans TaxID=2742612 RepID=A0A1R4HUZ2_9GAMM|nr:hypothetical protein CZ787_05560 [Halomonas citrativorans]